MAFNHESWSLSFTIEDDAHRASTLGFWFDPTLTEAQMVTKADAIGAKLLALTDGRVSSYMLAKRYKNDATVVIPNPAEVGRKLALTFTDATGRYISSVEVPSPIFDVEQVGTTIVDPGATAFVEFVEAVVTAGARTYAGTDITRVLPGARIVHRKRKEQK